MPERTLVVVRPFLYKPRRTHQRKHTIESIFDVQCIDSIRRSRYIHICFGSSTLLRTNNYGHCFWPSGTYRKKPQLDRISRITCIGMTNGSPEEKKSLISVETH